MSILGVSTDIMGITYHLRAIRRDAAGNIVGCRDSAPCKNVFTNHGVDTMFTDTAAGAMFVGSGNTPPTITDNNMAAFMAGLYVGGYYWTNVSRTDLGGNIYEIVDKITGTFALGAVVGNVAEVGWTFDRSATSTTPLASRALVVDEMGAPTTFPVQADEQLQLTLFATRRVNYADRVTNITVNGASYTVTARPYHLSQAAVFSGAASNIDQVGNDSYNYGNTFGLATPISGNVTGTAIGHPNPTSAAAYVAGSKQRAYTVGVPTGTAYNISGFTIGLNNCGVWQVKFDPPIPKSALQKFTAAFTGSINNPTT